MDLESTVKFFDATIRIPRPVCEAVAAAVPPDGIRSIDSAGPTAVEPAALQPAVPRGATIRRSNGKLFSAYGQPVSVREVTTRSERDRFLNFPWRIYAGDKNWCPPLLIEAKAFIDRKKHPFYKHGDAALFMAYVSGEVVGRILVSDDPNYNAQHETNQGTFGMFESIDDRGVASALLDAAAAWLRGRGRTAMVGPIDYSTNYPCGLLIDGFDTPQRVMMNHHPRYYARLLDDAGLHKAADIYAWWFDDSRNVLTRWASRAARLAERGNVVVRPIRFTDFEDEIARCKQIYNSAWENNWGFVKMTDAEFDHLARELKHYAIPDLIMLAEVDGEPAGFCVTLPDFNEAVRPLNGRLTSYGLPIGLLKLLRNMRRIKTARMAVLGVVEKFRRRGVAEMFILRALERGRQIGFTGAELGWTLETNELINRAIEKVGGERYKTYRIYHTAI